MVGAGGGAAAAAAAAVSRRICSTLISLGDERWRVLEYSNCYYFSIVERKFNYPTCSS